MIVMMMATTPSLNASSRPLSRANAPLMSANGTARARLS
jgi:hypothetical protein